MFYGKDVGLRLARKHLGWYADEAGAPLKSQMQTSTTVEATQALIRSAFAEADPNGDALSGDALRDDATKFGGCAA